ncbi:MAG: hypothetical protein Q9202_002224 [Teloschistes flavicans]
MSSSSSSTSTTPQHSPVYHVPQLCEAAHYKSQYPYSTIQFPDEDTPLDRYVNSNPSTPSFDYYSDNRPLDTQYMTADPSYNPSIRVRKSTPGHGLPDLAYNSPPSMVRGGENNSWDSYDHPTHLSPQSLQQQAINGYRTHRRIPSDSSVASVGPDSPYTQSLVYPQIVDSDSGLFPSAQIDSYDSGYPSAAQYSKSQYAPQTSQNHESFLAPGFQGYDSTPVDAESYHAIQAAMRQALVEQHQRGSIMSQPTLPTQGSFGDEFNELSRMPSGQRSSNVAKFNRTMSDIYQDELYNPSMATSAPPQPSRQHIPQENLLSPQNNSMFNDLLQVAQKGHVTARSASPVTSATRGRSPFPTERFSHSTPNSPARLTSAAQIRQQQKAESDARAFVEHLPRPTDILPPRTISPGEVALDYNEADEDAKMPLFNQDNKRENQLAAFATSTPNLSQSDVDDNTSERSYSNMATRRRRGSNLAATTVSGQSGSTFTFMPPSVPGVQMPQQYPFISQLRRQDSSLRSTTDQVPDFPTHLTSMESSKSETTQSDNPIRPDFPSSAESTQRSPSSPALQRPSDTAAASGTFACISPSCAARFDTAPKLQKHRREAHRNSPPPRPSAAAPTTSSTSTPTPMATPSSSSAAMHRNQQTGPHKCERINPSTGKPCNTIFSRSYDLTRHEDTIHSNRKQKVRCHLCTEDKTFSRNDALTRHMRVVHPEVDFPGKTKRRGG